MLSLLGGPLRRVNPQRRPKPLSVPSSRQNRPSIGSHLSLAEMCDRLNQREIGSKKANVGDLQAEPLRAGPARNHLVRLANRVAAHDSRTIEDHEICVRSKDSS